MKGGTHNCIPEDYVCKQWAVNREHIDKRPENESDQDSIWDVVSAEDLGLPRSVLDIGCRTGYSLRQLQRALPNARLVGVDIVPGFIERAQETEPSINWLVGNMHNLPFEDGEFELTICLGTLEHAYNVQLAAIEMQRVSQRLIVTADLADEMRGSDFTCSSRPSEWIALFENPSWHLVRTWTELGCLVPRALFMEWRRG